MVTAQQFGQVFERVTHEQMPTLLRHWPNPPLFTQYIKHEMMPSVASGLDCALGLEYQMDSRRIDLVLTNPANSSRTPPARSIIAAIEHENNFINSHEEITKLRDFGAPLGVLITYVSPHRRQRLSLKFAEIMAASASKADASEQNEYLVIFGPYGMKPPVTLTWEYLLYQGDRFHPLHF